jgi:hypothetical protein
MINEIEKKEEGKGEKIEVKTKRGRRPNGETRDRVKSDRTKNKFVMDLSKDLLNQSKVHDLLDQLNDKDFGNNISFKDLGIYAVGKVTSKDIEKLQEMSLTDQQKLKRFWKESNEKNKKKLSYEEFLVKKLNIN